MIPSHQLPLVGLLLFSLIPRQQCEICEISRENYTALNPLINTMINSKYSKGIQAANVLLSLRLGGILNQTQEQKLMRQIVRSSSLTSGQLALSILALGACKRPDEMFKNYSDLVKQLENKFQEEIKNMEEHDDNPLTNYYQLSLDVLALCLFSGNYSISIVATKFNPENKNYYFHGQFSVDTGAMAVLALTCVMRDKTNSQNIMYKQDLEIIGGHIGKMASLETYIVQEKPCRLSLSHHTITRKEIPKGVFRMPTAAAQILPALLGKTYLDVNKDSPCVYKSGAFNLSTQEPTSGPPAVSHPQIQVNYSVVINTTYNIVVSVANGSVFLDVMEKAQKENATLFSFTAEESSWGPYITTVQGIKANSNERTYWALLSNGKPLSQGKGVLRP
uniref:Transcobalamin 1 n=1 Tax=Canis lupus dingo TaxID=286419 RepID=A0A8C0JG98_CANLU